MPFLTQLEATHIKDELWELDSPLVYLSHETDITIQVPKLFPSDFASIPRVLLSLFGRPSGAMVEPSVLHDFLYSGATVHTRIQADQLFREALADKGIGWIKRNAMYSGVRAFGGSRWIGNE